MSKLYLSFYLPFGVLGFYRGTQHYNYNYRKDMEKYDENLKEYNGKLEEYNKNVEENNKREYKYTFTKPTLYYEKPYYLYSHSILYSLFGTAMYVNPFTRPFMAMKEVYRLEINMRGELDELKKKDFYYKILF